MNSNGFGWHKITIVPQCKRRRSQHVIFIRLIALLKITAFDLHTCVPHTHNYRPDNESFRLTIINSIHATQFSALVFFSYFILCCSSIKQSLTYILCNQFAITSEQITSHGPVFFFGRRTKKRELNSTHFAVKQHKKNIKQQKRNRIQNDNEHKMAT